MANEPVPSKSSFPSKSDKPMPLAAVVAIGALAVLGAITLVSWAFSAVFGILKLVALVVVAIAVFSWLVGRRLDR